MQLLCHRNLSYLFTENNQKQWDNFFPQKLTKWDLFGSISLENLLMIPSNGLMDLQTFLSLATQVTSIRLRLSIALLRMSMLWRCNSWWSRNPAKQLMNLSSSLMNEAVYLSYTPLCRNKNIAETLRCWLIEVNSFEIFVLFLNLFQKNLNNIIS